MKGKRQQKILELIASEVILTQEDLQSALKHNGFDVTQSTVSRDINELRLIKGHDLDGNYRYVTAESTLLQPSHSGKNFRELFCRSVKSIDYALNNVVIKCFNGMASSACVAVDALYSEQMLGSLAGDDTIIIVTRSEEDSATLVSNLKSIL